VGNRFLFKGRDYLAAMGLYDNRKRMYHPRLGRFLQVDPIGFAGDPANLYRYLGHNPMSGSDPMGEDLWDGSDWSIDWGSDLGSYPESLSDFAGGYSYESGYPLFYEGAFDSYTSQFAQFVDGGFGPDADGSLTFEEANAWWRNVVPYKGDLTASISDLQITDVYASDFDDQGIYHYSTWGSSSFPVYGSIQLNLLPGNTITAHADDYDFDRKEVRWYDIKGHGRNRATEAGRILAGEGTPYTIWFKGSITVPDERPWPQPLPWATRHGPY
jgi:RHS repeat-associated protein